VNWTGNSDWYLIETVVSFTGQRYRWSSDHFTEWFAGNAFGGENYSNTPIGAVTYVDEPYEIGINDVSIYFGLWASGKNSAICAWSSRKTSKFQAVGDPFIKK
jgi:hypothetical protein